MREEYISVLSTPIEPDNIGRFGRWMREEYISVLSTPIEPDNIGRFGRYRYIGKTQTSADISVDL